MPLQNHVDPWGRIVATSERGSMMGNRGGRFHRSDRTLANRRWASHHWICCELSYKGLHHEPMGKGYTSLFFLDEVTALTAGHRPCFFCRRAEAKAFLGGRGADEFDRQLHEERTSPLPRERSAAQRTGEGTAMPDGVMLEIEGNAYAVKGSKLLEWSFAGYIAARAPQPTTRGRLLTPPSIIAILAKGYKPRWHESALTGDDE